MSPRWFFGAFFGHASFAYFFRFGSFMSKSNDSWWSCCWFLNWTDEIGLLETSISGAGFGRAGKSDDAYMLKESSLWSLAGSEIEGRPAYKVGAEMMGWWRMCFCSTCGVDGKLNELDPPSIRIRLWLTGTTVDWTRLRNLPIDGSTSSGFMTISSSLKWTRFRLEPFFATKASLMPRVEIFLLWAVLYSVKFWSKRKVKLDYSN